MIKVYRSVSDTEYKSRSSSICWLTLKGQEEMYFMLRLSTGVGRKFKLASRNFIQTRTCLCYDLVFTAQINYKHFFCSFKYDQADTEVGVHSESVSSKRLWDIKGDY